MKNDGDNISNDLDKDRQSNDFLTTFNGKFYGVLRWKQLDDLWQVVKHDDENGWYIYAVGEPLPIHKKTGKSVNTYVDALNKLLRREHDEDYCGVVYTDSFETPRLIIVFDPNNLSVFCCIVTPALLSSWIISKMCQKNYSIKIQGVGNRWWETILINSLDG